MLSSAYAKCDGYRKAWFIMAKHEQLKKYIKIRKAAEHNLKEIDLDVPRDEFVVFT